ncbi:MAG: hypothetical protein WD021_07600, partial [Rhodothermales bacterium]
LLSDKTFEFIGPGDRGLDALIDTSSSQFDSIFTVDATDHTVAVVQELKGFDLDVPEGLLPTFDVDPIALSFSADDVSGGTPAGSGSTSFSFQPNGQSIGSGGTVVLTGSDVQFGHPDDYVELSSGAFRVEDIVNEMDVAFDELVLSVASIRSPPYGPADSLVIRFVGHVDAPEEGRFHRIERRSGPRDAEIDLAGYRLYADENEISYHAQGRIEVADDERALNTSDELRLSLGIANVTLSGISAEIDPIEVSLSEDADGDGRVDVFDDREAETAGFDGLNVFDGIDLGDFQLVGSELRLNVRSNIAADFALYAVLVGLDDAGEATYLEGRGDAAVNPSDPVVASFAASGMPIDAGRMIRLQIEGSPSPDQTAERIVALHVANSNVDAFISQAPVEIRMAARIIIQPDGGRVHLREPFLLETSFGVSIPLAVSSGFSIDKTFDVDLSELEEFSADTNEAAIDEGELVLTYQNALPLGLDLGVDVLDAFDDAVATFPKTGQSMHVLPAATDGDGLADAPSDGMFSIGVTRADLQAMSRGERIRLRFSLTTDGSGIARLRATDTFIMRLRGSFRVRINVD